MRTSREFMESDGLPGGDPVDCPSSGQRFPDGGEYRIEIPSTEGPRVLGAVLDEAGKRKVPVHRVSQGSGIMLMTDDEIVEMLEMGRAAAIEVNLFLGPRATFDIGAQAYSPAGVHHFANTLSYRNRGVRTRACRVGTHADAWPPQGIRCRIYETKN